MSVPTIAIYASPPGGICSTQSTSGGILDSDFNPRHHSSSTSTSAPNQRSISGGISCLFSSSSLPSPRHIVSAPCSSAFAFGDQRSDDLTSYSDFGYSYKSVSHGHNQSPAAPALMLQAPVTREKFASSSPSKIPTHNDQPIDLGELAFSMEDEFVESSETANCYEEYATEMLSGARAEHTIFNDEFVTKAFYEAEKAHRGQLRASGDPYLRHCVETALLLANVGADATVVATGLLHDTVDDCSIDHGYIARTLDAQVADLVDGVTKLSQLSKLARENNTADKIVEADRLHTLFLAITDTRAVLVKLADRLHNMMTLESLPFVKQQRFAKETMEIYAPLANRLGISSWKQQLENLCFKHLNPEQYWEISSKLATKLDKAVFIAYSKEKLEYALKRAGVSYHDLSGRHKSLFSIYAKMRKKKLNMNQIHDIHGLRLIVENEEDCYKALDIVHHLWPRCESSRRTKDYIARPKFNGYRSLHTVVMSHDEAPLEVQIRTMEMHHQAEFGFAAHWRYKEGKHMYSKSVVQMVEWARWVVKCHCLVRDGSVNNTLADLSSSSFSYKPTNMHTGPVFITVLENDKMSVEEFPAHSTLMDLFGRLARASSRWSGYSLAQKEELRPRLNHQPVELLDRFRKLMMGDIVELTPQIPVKSLSGYRDEIQRMYDANVVSASCEIPCTT